MTEPVKSIVVLISGSGSNLQALIDAQQAGKIPAKIAGVLSNRADAFGLERAKKAQIPVHVIDHRQFSDRLSFDQEMIQVIDQWQPDLVILAGFMRILTDDFVRHYDGKMLNVHPSLLPKYKGLNTHQRAIEAGDAFHGCSVHFVSPELDSGQIIAQARVAIDSSDTPKSLADKVQALEHQLYPLCAQWFCSGQLIYKSDKLQLDDQILGPTGKMVTL